MKRWIAAALLASTTSAMAADALVQGFADPPAAARPRTWWHWLNGNITVAGLDADLEWMKRVGLGGAQAFDASLGTPRVVDHPIPYMTPEWKAAFDHAAATARRLDLELAISSSPGWSETGGPWVAPADAMKKLVWTITEVDGGRPIGRPLPAPSSVTGPYGTAPFSDPLASTAETPQTPLGSASGPVAVLAWPVSATSETLPVVTAQDGATLDAARLADDREDTDVLVPRPAGGPPTVLLAYPEPRTVRSAAIYVPSAIMPFGGAAFAPVLEAQTPAGWAKVASLPLGNVPTTVTFAPVTAARFRVRFFAPDRAPPGLAAPAPGAVVVNIFPEAPPGQPVRVATLKLSSATQVDRFEAKAGFAAVPDYYALSVGAPVVLGVDPTKVVNLSARMRPDGTLDWSPPPGRWRIARMGWSLLGTTNHPAASEATGLEVDKYDGAAVRRYMDHYLATYAQPIAAKNVEALLTDSIEAGDANWTPGLLARFRRLRGYDPTPWLPVLTGAVIGSTAQADAFLYDWRRTLADLLASEHYGTIADAAHSKGLKVYGEALENGRPQLGDDEQMRMYADVPMAAMWAFGKGEAPRPTLVGDVLGAASVAHLTGRNLVAAESFTASFAPWAYAPADLKRVADMEFALGVNRPVIHTSVSSPMDDKLPGLSLAIFGQYFNRRDTWATMARPWIDYLARTSFLMQQGRHVADVAYFYGEEAPLTALYEQRPLADAPTNRGFDFVNASFLAGLTVDGGDIVSGGGARYRVLYLGGTASRMTLATLRRVAALAEAGAAIVGDRPAGSPSLGDDPKAYASLVGRLWPGGASTRVGQGMVYAGRDVEAAFAGMALAPDMAGGAGLLFQHRATRDTDIYLIHNPGGAAFAGTLRFRVAHRAASEWAADTGQMRPLTWRSENEATTVPLTLPPEGTMLIVLRPTAETGANVPPTAERIVANAAAPWSVTFESGRGAPAGTTLATLGGLDQQADPGLRYYSGVATYTGHIDAPRAGGRLLLDLGRVGDVAEVAVNGKSIGTAWHAPYRIDATGAVHPGVNTLTVRVANLWVNRLIGDAQPGAVKVTFTAAPTYRPNAPLRPAGLIGPVRLIERTIR